MTELKLIPLLRHILPAVVMKRLSFIFSTKDCHDYKLKYPSFHKMYDKLLRKTASRAVCLENQILFVDVRPVSMKHNPVGICYLPYPFGELHYPNESRVIPNVATDIISFIYPLHRFGSVDEYMLHSIRPSQRHYVA